MHKMGYVTQKSWLNDWASSLATQEARWTIGQSVAFLTDAMAEQLEKLTFYLEAWIDSWTNYNI